MDEYFRSDFGYIKFDIRHIWDFIIKFGSRLYFRSNLSIHRSKIFFGTVIKLDCALSATASCCMTKLVVQCSIQDVEHCWYIFSPWEKDVMYRKRSAAILCAKWKRSSTPDVARLRLFIVSNLRRNNWWHLTSDDVILIEAKICNTRIVNTIFVVELALSVTNKFFPNQD